MKFRGTKLSKRTMALLAAAVIMLGASGIGGTRAALEVFSPDYDAQIKTDSISVQLLETVNNKTVDVGGTDEKPGELFTSLNGKVEPGMTYTDKVSVKNDGAASEYVRVIVRKYWTKPDGEPVPADEPSEEPAEESSESSTSKKDTKLSPDMIELELADGWIETEGGSPETTIYYLKRPLTTGGEGSTADLFKSVRVDKSVATARTVYLNGKEIKESEVSSVKEGIITYVYKYNGYTFNVEAEAQSVQTHHPEDAMKSVWGVDVSVSGGAITSVK